MADPRLVAILPLVAAALQRRRVEPDDAIARWWTAGDLTERWWTWKNLPSRSQLELAQPLLPAALRAYFGGLDWASDTDWWARSLVFENAVELRWLHGADDTRIVTHVQAWRLRFAGSGLTERCRRERLGGEQPVGIADDAQRAAWELWGCRAEEMPDWQADDAVWVERWRVAGTTDIDILARAGLHAAELVLLEATDDIEEMD